MSDLRYNLFSKKNYNLTKEFERSVPKHLEFLENSKYSSLTMHNKELLIRLQKNKFNINKQKDFLVKAFFHMKKYVYNYQSTLVL